MKLSTIALRYLKGQKKHTIMTIIATVISVAFLTTLLSGLSVYRASALNIAERTNGTYHILFNSLDKEQLLALKSLPIFEKTENYGISVYSTDTDMDFGLMEKENASLEYLMINDTLVDEAFLRLPKDGLTMFPETRPKLTDGRMPEKDGELVISDYSADMWGYPAIGDTVTARLITCKAKGTGDTVITENIPDTLTNVFDTVSDEEITFTVVGYSEHDNIVNYSDTRLKSYSWGKDNLIARFSDQANDFYWDLHYALADKGIEIDDLDYSFNQELLDLEGKGVTAKFSQALFFAVMYLAVLFIMFCVRLVIDNSFEIASAERIKQFGLLKAVGASKKQIFMLVIWEAIYLAIPGTALGILLGTGIFAAAFSAVKELSFLGSVSSEYDFATMLEFDIKPYVYITSAVIGILWVIVSAISTGLRSIKASPVEAMRAAGKSEKIRVPRKPSGLEKGSSFIGAYSKLSIKRNRKRYMITMLSMVMSVMLFTLFSYGLEAAQERIDKVFGVYRRPADYVISYTAYEPFSVYDRAAEMEAAGCFEDIRVDAEAALYDKSSNTLYLLHPISRAAFEKDIVSPVSYDDILGTGRFILCAADYTEEGEYLSERYRTAPQSISVTPFVSDSMEFLNDLTFECAGLYTTDFPTYRSRDNNVLALMPEEDYSELMNTMVKDNYTFTNTAPDGSNYCTYYRCITAFPVQGMEQEAKTYLDKRFIGIYDDNAADNAKAQGILEAVKIIGYFVIAIISLIAVVNIVNIISSNVLGRTPELAMLRACGMTDKQVRRLVIRESLMYAASASITALVLTELAIFAVRLPFITHFHDLTFDDIGFEPSFIAPLKYIVPAAAAAFVSALFAAWFPSSRMIRTPIVENIRNTEQV